MIGLGALGMLVSLGILWMLWKGRNPKPDKWWQWTMAALPFLPLVAIIFGWIMAEMGRQPWIVAGVLPTASAVSPGVRAWVVLLSLILYTAIYGALAVVEFGLILKYNKAGLPDVAPVEVITDEDAPLSFAY